MQTLQTLQLQTELLQFRSKNSLTNLELGKIFKKSISYNSPRGLPWGILVV